MKIVVICRMSDDKVKARLKPLINLDDVDIIYLIRRTPINLSKVINYSPPKWMQNILLFSEMYRLFALFFVCLTKQPDVLYGIYFVPHGIYAALGGWIFRKPVIQELIGTDRPKVMGSKLLLKMLKSADHISVRGKSSRKQLINYGVPAEIIFLSQAVNALDFEHYKPDKSLKNFDLIYCGRMDNNKQLDILIRAVSALEETLPSIKMIFVGDGPERERLEALTKALGVEQNITFVGNQPYENIPNYLNQSKVFVMSSAFEGLPVAMLEALSCGLPVVVPNVGDIADLAHQGVNGLLVEGASPDTYVEALESILSDEHLYLRLVEGAFNTRQRLIDYYTLDKVSDDFRKVLQRISQ